MEDWPMQSPNRIFDDLARVANGAVAVATGMRQEIEALVRQQFERFLTDRDLVSREEFEAVRLMAEKARAENEALAARLTALETGAKPAAKAAPKAAPKSGTRRRAASKKAQ
ncbi:MAG: accessory factor UbiK family protein [Pseudomonadota bacterium]|nr:accessory factor UbiK family protein [Pseudomonadota bacterium]MEC8062515.1 accessory factor UbiK family protein [Pseudomonadota bacterium]MEC8083197.1 accessory factor UbiK family protein [Pseudomonadota bacterium]MEC8282477.1 accessory factor UbiK family protein [Pseudomonadota bacterium]MEC8319053.1 accessory factor UbiK family protein [Pseudomonadota bacterium]